MPKLPSGMNLFISNMLALEPNINFFECPEGHFWYQTPDLAINKPPFESGRQIILDFVHAPVPKDREEAKRYIQVLIGLEGDTYYWRGDKLSEFPSNGELDEADLAVWNEWLESESTREFLDETIDRCRIQAESNRHNSGVLTMRPVKRDESSRSDEVRLREIGRRVGALETLADDARARNDEEKAREVFVELEELLDEVAAIRRRFDQEGGIGAYVEGYVNRVLRRWSTAKECFREYLRTMPFHAEAWLELTWCLSEQDELADAEATARRAVKLAPGLPGAWGNLATVLIQLGDRDEARQALDRALELDPDDPKNRYTDQNFDRYFEARAGKRDDETPRLQEVPN